MNPTAAAIETAARNAMRDASKYTLDHFATDLWMVQRKGDPSRTYSVVVDRDGMNCDCPAWQRSGVCKHEKMVADELAIRAEEAAEEAMEEARFLMSWTSDVHHHPDADLFLLTDAA